MCRGATRRRGIASATPLWQRRGVDSELEIVTIRTHDDEGLLDEFHGTVYWEAFPDQQEPVTVWKRALWGGAAPYELTEVAAVLYYLAKRFPAAGLFPEGDLEAEAQIVSWMSFTASTIHPARRIGVERWKEVFEIAEKRLAWRDWAVGRYSIADIHLFRLFWRFFTTLHPAADAYPGLFAHYERMMARPAVKKTIEIEAAVGYQLPQ